MRGALSLSALPEKSFGRDRIEPMKALEIGVVFCEKDWDLMDAKSGGQSCVVHLFTADTLFENDASPRCIDAVILR